MDSLPINLIIFSGVLLLVLLAATVLQIILSTRQNKNLGLILPAANILFSLTAIFGFANFAGSFSLDVIMTSLMVFFIYNIPTLILLLIYYICRKKIDSKKDIDKMNIQDL
ncbi:hypothetical protein CHL78_007285 [Romboutsia weinsteinii]|uniref:Uncharacterized protein n=1 Tax=Romboutsia weinsteinii TaxID=2020949 RepID=A0A371J5Y8_9FIRM|nr:hypothetical protein [Romboutsia weinsteinii]RDY28097.1 hypothetical protein CHL78_007285 [Romboutsia weinsteinii]